MVQLVFWGVVVVFIAAMFFRGWRKQVRSLRTETPEEAYRRVEANRRADGEHQHFFPPTTKPIRSPSSGVPGNAISAPQVAFGLQVPEPGGALTVAALAAVIAEATVGAVVAAEPAHGTPPHETGQTIPGTKPPYPTPKRGSPLI